MIKQTKTLLATAALLTVASQSAFANVNTSGVTIEGISLYISVTLHGVAFRP